MFPAKVGEVGSIPIHFRQQTKKLSRKDAKGAKKTIVIRVILVEGFVFADFAPWRESTFKKEAVCLD